ncbi:hypothetical protein BGX29_001457 [Mortierella sp. GBA35]|nr:hypothetical protein BGX29_001457 [Mortierella sp. GBA35]
MSVPPQVKFLSIPELVKSLDAFLTPQDLFALIRVSRCWNDVFIPSLWRSIDDKPLLGPGFSSWRVIINAAHEGETCTNLRSLRICDTFHAKTDKEIIEYNHALKTECLWTLAVTMQDAQQGPPLSPLFGGSLITGRSGYRTEHQSKQDWVTTQRMWHLILQNPSTLRALQFDGLDFVCVVSDNFIYNMLATLPNLTDLSHDRSTLDIGMMLDRLPKLTHLSFPQYRPNIWQTYTQLRDLDLRKSITSQDFFKLLKFLPNLDTLRFEAFDDEDEICTRAQIITDDTPHRLKRLLVDHGSLESVSYAAKEHPLQRPAIDPPTFRGDEFPEPLGPGTLFQRAATSPSELSNLRVLDVVAHKVEANALVAEPWACHLETFRYLLAGFVRLTEDETSVLVGERKFCSQQEIDFIVNKHQQSQEQHTKVYDRLATMTNLVTLDIGAEYRERYSEHLAMYINFPMYQVDGEQYIDYGRLVRDTPELSLASGLARLGALENLEVFGFEGVDHRIGKSELEWMAINWPKLKVMRGLQEDDLPKLQYDRKKAELREYMQHLRPDVRHETCAPSEPGELVQAPTWHVFLALRTSSEEDSWTMIAMV